MGDRDDFYVAENMIGITGPVHELPTVYFFNQKSGEYGHITQVHAADWNAGRTTVDVDRGWKIVNQCGGACKCGRSTAHEFNGRGEMIHPSRNVFVARADMAPGDIEVAMQAIYRCPYYKTDPMTQKGRDQEDVRYDALWQERHQKGPSGRRGAIDYTAEGLANRVYGIAYPDRVK